MLTSMPGLLQTFHFLNSWVREPRKRLGRRIGCEVNFNRIFPKRADIPSSEQLAKELGVLAGEMAALQKELEAASVRRLA